MYWKKTFLCTLIYSYVLIFFIFIKCLLIPLCYKYLQEEKSLASIARNIMMSTLIMVHLVLYTSIGQVVQDSVSYQFQKFLTEMTFSNHNTYRWLQNERFRNSLYNIQWYSNKSMKFRKLFLIVLCSTRHVRSLQASSSYVASHELFYNIIKMSYSFYNVINKAFSR